MLVWEVSINFNCSKVLWIDSLPDNHLIFDDLLTSEEITISNEMQFGGAFAGFDTC